MLPQKSLAQLNDHARRHWYVPGLITTLLTRGVQALAPCCDSRRALLEQIAGCDDFDPGNDPYGEHDFGALTFRGERIFWKFDYYDLSLQYGSPNPQDVSQTRRVMTVMLASEY
jgi:hypothetical protein